MLLCFCPAGWGQSYQQQERHRKARKVFNISKERACSANFHLAGIKKSPCVAVHHLVLYHLAVWRAVAAVAVLLQHGQVVHGLVEAVVAHVLADLDLVLGVERVVPRGAAAQGAGAAKQALKFAAGLSIGGGFLNDFFRLFNRNNSIKGKAMDSDNNRSSSGRSGKSCTTSCRRRQQQLK